MMKLQVLKKAPLALLLLLAGLLLVTGCSSNGGDGGGGGVSAGSVEEVSLAGTAGTADFQSFSTSISLPASKEEALESAINGIGLLGYTVVSYMEEHPDWEPTSGSYSMTPENPEDFETASAISIDASMSNESLNLTFTDSYDQPFNGSATMSAVLNMDASKSDVVDTDGSHYPDRISGSAGLSGAQVSFSGIEAPGDVDFGYIESLGGKVFLGANANIDVDPKWRNGSDGYLEMYAVDAAFGVSVAVSAALSIDDNQSGEYAGGNYLIQASYLDTATLQITETLMNDPDALGQYLEGALDGGDFSFSITVYDDTPAEVASYTYTVDWLTTYFESQETVQ